tara:strand:- start:95 stop:607 length:513 start_codon:yes stop_codon:yes gene_type:complete
MPNTLTKEIKYTAVWGGGLARMTSLNGRWVGIPTGHMAVNAVFGTSSDPDTSYTVSTTADDLGGVIWSPLSTIIVRKCRIYYGEGGSVNTTHSVNLSKYDIDSEGDLTNGTIVGSTATDSGSDDYTTLAYTDLSVVANTVTSTQVLIAFIMCVDAINSSFTAKCIIEYTM